MKREADQLGAFPSRFFFRPAVPISTGLEICRYACLIDKLGRRVLAEPSLSVL